MRDRENMIRTVERLNAITQLQADAINDLFGLLEQHIEAEELEHIPATSRVNEAATLRAEGGGGYLKREGRHRDGD